MNQAALLINDFIQVKDFSKVCFLRGLCSRDEMQKAIEKKRWEVVSEMEHLGYGEEHARTVISELSGETGSEVL